MKHAVLYAAKDLRSEECEIPEIDEHEVLIKNKISTTCGTDVKIYNRGYPLLKPPHVFGHEFSGEIVKAGKYVQRFKVGDRVAVHNTAPCNTCYYCKHNQPGMCENLLFNRGTYAQYVRVPAAIVKQNMFLLKDDMSYKTASLLEPFACAVYGIEQTEIHQGDTIVVNGAGPIGLMFIRLAVLRGAFVIATDLSVRRLKMAQKMGAAVVLQVGETDDIQAKIQALSEHRGADVVIEATGQINVWETSLGMVRKGGIVLLFGGTPSGTTLSIDAKQMHYDQLTIKGVFHTTPLCVEAAFHLLEMNVIRAEDFVQHEYTLDCLEQALLEHANQKVIKNCIRYD